MRQIPIPLSPLPEQHRIVAKIEELFTRLDAGVEALKKIKAQLKRYRQAVLKYAFEGKLTQEWREANKGKIEPASVLLERIKEERKKEGKGKLKELPPIDTSDLPELPEGWVWTTVGDLLRIYNKWTITSRPNSYSDVRNAFMCQRFHRFMVKDYLIPLIVITTLMTRTIFEETQILSLSR